MKPELLSFDAAGTLIEVDWHPGRFAVECAQALGWSVDPQSGRERYERLLGTRWREYCEVNQLRNDEACERFWQDLAADWLDACGLESAKVAELSEVAHEGLYGAEQQIFRLYTDALPALEKLRGLGYRMVVLSNWDYSLHRVLRNLGIADFFEIAFASLQEGPEKPDPALFRIVTERTGVPASSIVHIGDHPLDDLEGARQAGFGALFLDRSLAAGRRPVLASLGDLPDALEWLG